MHAHNTELNKSNYENNYKQYEYWILSKHGGKQARFYTIIRLSLDDTGVSQQMAFISGPSLLPFPQHIFEIFQNLAVAEIKW